MGDVIDGLWPYLFAGIMAFAAATLIPLSSEATLFAQIKADLGSTTGLVAAATVGNVGGSTVNWWLGGALLRFQDRRWFPFQPATIAAATTRFQRYGIWTLLLSWLPVVGDPLTLVAGVLRVPLWQFLPLVALGKAGRYIAVAWFA